MIRRGVKDPNGEWKSREQLLEPLEGAATGLTQRSRRPTGANRKRGWSERFERAVSTSGRKRSDRRGALTPGWRLRKEAAVTGERNAVASFRSWSIAASGVPEGIDSAGGENVCGGTDRRSARRDRLRCSVRCMPAESKAGNQVTWNHFLFSSLSSPIAYPSPCNHRGPCGTLPMWFLG